MIGPELREARVDVLQGLLFGLRACVFVDRVMLFRFALSAAPTILSLFPF